MVAGADGEGLSEIVSSAAGLAHITKIICTCGVSLRTGAEVHNARARNAQVGGANSIIELDGETVM